MPPRACLRLELLGQASDEYARGAAGNEVQEGLVKEEAELPGRRRVATIEDDVVRRDGELTSEDREQRGEARRPPGDLDEHPIADPSGGPKIDERGLSNGSRRAAVEDREVEIGRNVPQLRVVRRSVRRSTEPGEVAQSEDRPIEIDRARPAETQRDRHRLAGCCGIGLH